MRRRGMGAPPEKGRGQAATGRGGQGARGVDRGFRCQGPELLGAVRAEWPSELGPSILVKQGSVSGASFSLAGLFLRNDSPAFGFWKSQTTQSDGWNKP